VCATFAHKWNQIALDFFLFSVECWVLVNLPRPGIRRHTQQLWNNSEREVCNHGDLDVRANCRGIVGLGGIASCVAPIAHPPHARASCPGVSFVSLSLTRYCCSAVLIQQDLEHQMFLASSPASSAPADSWFIPRR
jgi:hypothetical protein